MKKTSKIKLIPVILSMLITSSCSFLPYNQEEKQQQNWEEQALQVRTTYLSLTEGTGKCSVTADYGQRVYTFDMILFLKDTEDGLSTTMTLTAPEEIQGITATYVGNTSQLLWADLILETGDLNDTGLSPVNALPILLENLKKGYIHSATVKEMFTPTGTQAVLELFTRNPDLPLGEGTETVIWLESETQKLLGGEIYQDGARVITCQVSDFVFM